VRLSSERVPTFFAGQAAGAFSVPHLSFFFFFSRLVSPELSLLAVFSARAQAVPFPPGRILFFPASSEGSHVSLTSLVGWLFEDDLFPFPRMPLFVFSSPVVDTSFCGGTRAAFPSYGLLLAKVFSSSVVKRDTPFFSARIGRLSLERTLPSFGDNPAELTGKGFFLQCFSR